MVAAAVVAELLAVIGGDGDDGVGAPRPRGLDQPADRGIGVCVSRRRSGSTRYAPNERTAS